VNCNNVDDNGAQDEIIDLIDAVVDSAVTLTGNTTSDTNVDGVLDAVNDIDNVVTGNTNANTSSGDNNVGGVQDAVNDIVDAVVDNVFTGIQDYRDTVLDQISDIQTAPELKTASLISTCLVSSAIFSMALIFKSF
jgi:hypothetical protein